MDTQILQETFLGGIIEAKYLKSNMDLFEGQIGSFHAACFLRFFQNFATVVHPKPCSPNINQILLEASQPVASNHMGSQIEKGFRGLYYCHPFPTIWTWVPYYLEIIFGPILNYKRTLCPPFMVPLSVRLVLIVAHVGPHLSKGVFWGNKWREEL